MDSKMTAYLIIMAVCLILSAYFSATETAFSSINKTRLRTMAEKGNKKAKLALELYENYDKLISTILIGNNIVNICTASLGTVLFVGIYGDIGATISTVVVTVVVLIFGEITPKSLAKDCPEKFAMFSSVFIKALIWLFTPLNFIFSLWKSLINKIIKVDSDSKMSQEELLMIVDEVEQEGSLDKDESELLRNAIEFKDLSAEDILTHRVDIVAVPIDATKEEVAYAFSNSKFSRLLAYTDDSMDKIVGVIHQKDFYVGTGITEKSLADIATPPVFVTRNEKIDDLLRILQTNKSHVAVVLDDYGGTYGIVTMEDILEELVGEIWDEHDEVIEDIQQIGENLFSVNGSVEMEDFCRFFEIDIISESLILSGWIMEYLGRVPEEGEVFDYKNLRFTAEGIDFHRITDMKVEKLPEEAVSEEE